MDDPTDEPRPGDSPEPETPSAADGDPRKRSAESGDGTPDAATPRRRPAVAAAFLSAVVPGAGQWFTGNRRRALWYFLPVGILVAGGLLFAVLAGRVEIAVMSVQPKWLWTFLALNLLLLGIRGIATADAYQLGRRPSKWRWMGPVGLLVALMLTAVPHVWVAAYNIEWIDTLEAVFDPPVTTATTDPGAWAGPILTTTTTTVPGPTTSTTEGPDIGVPPIDLPPVTLPDEDFLPLDGLSEGRYLSILLAGGDAGPGRGGLRTDTMIVATLDLEMNRAYLFGISRELVHIPLPGAWNDAFEGLEDDLWEWELQEWIWDQPRRCRDGAEWKDDPPASCPPLLERPERCECFPDRLNAIYTYTRNWTATWPDSPDPGMEALRQAMQKLFAIPIDYYVLVDMAGFVALVDALGGVDIWVDEAVHAGFSPAVEGGPIVRVDVDPGWQHLDGNQALAYVRDRSVSGDSGRIRRQRCMVRSVAAAADPVDILWRFDEIATAIRDNTTTNIPLDFLPELVRVGANLSLDDIVTVRLTGSYYYEEKDFRNIPIPNLEHIRWRVRTVLEGSSEGSSEGEDGECGGPDG